MNSDVGRLTGFMDMPPYVTMVPPDLIMSNDLRQFSRNNAARLRRHAESLSSVFLTGEDMLAAAVVQAAFSMRTVVPATSRCIAGVSCSLERYAAGWHMQTHAKQLLICSRSNADVQRSAHPCMSRMVCDRHASCAVLCDNFLRQSASRFDTGASQPEHFGNGSRRAAAHAVERQTRLRQLRSF